MRHLIRKGEGWAKAEKGGGGMRVLRGSGGEALVRIRLAGFYVGRIKPTQFIIPTCFKDVLSDFLNPVKTESYMETYKHCIAQTLCEIFTHGRIASKSTGIFHPMQRLRLKCLFLKGT